MLYHQCQEHHYRHNLPAWSDFLAPFSRARLGWGTAKFLQQLQDTVTEVCITLVLILIDIWQPFQHLLSIQWVQRNTLQARDTETRSNVPVASRPLGQVGPWPDL